VYIAASSRCFCDLKFEEACQAIVDLEYDRIDIWLDESSIHLKPSEVAGSPDRRSERRSILRLIASNSSSLSATNPASEFRFTRRADN
jgi:hypothetical protein